MTIKIAVANQKGGVGKTTTTINLGAELEERGRTVMLVDLDPQASLTVSKGVKADLSMADVLGNHQPGTAKLSQVVRQVSARQWLAPADIALATAEQGMMQRIGREVLLKAALTPVKANYVLIDCPPSLGLLTVNALVAADWVLMCLERAPGFRTVANRCQELMRADASLQPGETVMRLRQAQRRQGPIR